MRVEVVIPWRGGCPQREAALQWVLGRHQQLDVTVAECPPGPWVKADAVMPAIEASPADIIVVADADVWTTGLAESIVVVDRRGGWAVPHRLVHRLTEEATAQILAGADPAGQQLEQHAYRGVAGGGIVVARRSLILDVPLDRRFAGWGGEDHAWGYALRTLHGEPWRGIAPLFHLWHPPQPRLTRRVGSHANDRLKRRYQAARGNPRRMRTLVEEARGQTEGRHQQFRGA